MRACPDCAKPMQPLFVKEARGEVELDRCAECGGVWFDYGELEAIVGREVPFESLPGETSRRCPDCTLTLTPVVLKGAVPVETCSVCRGMWLDFADVQQLGRSLERAVPPPPAAHRYEGLAPDDEPWRHVPTGDEAASTPQLGFACAKCGKRTPFAEGNATSKGLVCRVCVPTAPPPPKPARPGDIFDLSSLLAMFRLFR